MILGRCTSEPALGRREWAHAHGVTSSATGRHDPGEDGSVLGVRAAVWLVVIGAVGAVGCDRVFGLTIPVDAIDAADAPPPLEHWRLVSGGDAHTCGIRLDHTLWCWGRNDRGQLGRGTAASELEHPEPVRIGAGADWDQLAVGADTTCAIKLDRTLWCWGRNHTGQVGGGVVSELLPEPVQVAGTWTAVAAGASHACAIDDAAKLWCWGHGASGERGDGTGGGQPAIDSPTPVAVSGDGTWRQVVVGERSTCGLQTDDSLWCWGSDDHGRLGLGGGGARNVPTRVGAESWRAVTLRHQSACAIRADGEVRCWGANDHGQLGDGSVVARAVPTAIDDDVTGEWVAVDTGKTHACAIRATGELACWGRNHRGQLASDPDLLARTSPTPVTRVEGVGERWSSLGLGGEHSCAIDTAAQLWCAGLGATGALGTGGGSRLRPTAISTTWERPVAGDDATCAFSRGLQTVACWGHNARGLLADGSTRDQQRPPILQLGPWTQLDLGDHGCALDPNGAQVCWGPNDLGQLGTNTSASSTVPTPIFNPGAAAWAMVSASRSHTCAITKSSVLYCWGRNAERQTGKAAAVNDPVLAPSLLIGTTWKDVGTGIDFSCGLQLDNKAYCWGHSAKGQLGNAGATGTTATPQAVSTAQTFDRIEVGARHACALMGTSAWCWGWNQGGQLGTGSVSDQNVPLVLSGAWRELSLGEEHSCGIRTDGTLWCWGRNHHGQLGDGTTVSQPVATQVGTETTWTSVSAGLRHTCATTADGTLWCWGGNVSGAIGDGAAWRATLELVTR